jgi:hypothetical protein
MRNLPTSFNFTRVNGLRAEDVRRRVSECRERLRRGRGARRIPAHATPEIGETCGEEAETPLAAGASGETTEEV